LAHKVLKVTQVRKVPRALKALKALKDCRVLQDLKAQLVPGDLLVLKVSQARKDHKVQRGLVVKAQLARPGQPGQPGQPESQPWLWLTELGWLLLDLRVPQVPQALTALTVQQEHKDQPVLLVLKVRQGVSMDRQVQRGPLVLKDLKVSPVLLVPREPPVLMEPPVLLVLKDLKVSPVLLVPRVPPVLKEVKV
jgi:hypothetical protein